MKISDIESLLTMVSADASAIQTLTTEVSEEVEPNSIDYFKLHAAYELCETQMRNIERIEDGLLELRRTME